MSLLNSVKPQNENLFSLVGVGLRYPHYQEALKGTSVIDFVEVHAENFIAQGGLLLTLLHEINETYSVSLHSTSMGLGSATGVDSAYLEKLNKLVKKINPLLISDHASFAWSAINGASIHAGDLLPVEFSSKGLDVMSENIDRVQQYLGRRILVENLSSYLNFGQSTMSETEFLSKLVHRTECGLLVDLNNILVNLHNEGEQQVQIAAKQWLNEVPVNAVGELHLAGFTQMGSNELIVDDHSRPVSEDCWDLYAYAIHRFGAVTTLIEWDNDLPDWGTLLDQACKARQVIKMITKANERKVLIHEW